VNVGKGKGVNAGESVGVGWVCVFFAFITHIHIHPQEIGIYHGLILNVLKCIQLEGNI
jgi:hypothetical protein